VLVHQLSNNLEQQVLDVFPTKEPGVEFATKAWIHGFQVSQHGWFGDRIQNLAVLYRFSLVYAARKWSFGRDVKMGTSSS